MQNDIQIQTTLEEKVTSAQDELSKLKSKQDQLEKEQSKLQKLKVKLDAMADGKSELQPSLNKAVLSLERAIESNNKMNEELILLCEKLKEDQKNISSIDEPEIDSPDIENNLDKALIIIDEAKADFKKAMSRIEALSKVAGTEIVEKSGDIPQPSKIALMKIGFYAGVPVAILALIVAILYSIFLK
ncbi:MAG: hypothetical protein KAQ99_06695 [Candidatus Aureabacteria bacterium]|nr:hypothetical protein [Candidatus Auribacterota bacterium]MCK5161247.1 hypothetical protein [Candidatus Auribacterota bacterium]MCK5656091.1 hypothetical protein [Candidatus Auribacterota bacterium]